MPTTTEKLQTPEAKTGAPGAVAFLRGRPLMAFVIVGLATGVVL